MGVAYPVALKSMRQEQPLRPANFFPFWRLGLKERNVGQRRRSSGSERPRLSPGLVPPLAANLL